MITTNIDKRLTRLEQRPGSRVPRFLVKLDNGSTVTAHGYELLALSGVERVVSDGRQPCAGVAIALFQALNPGVEVVEDVQR